MNSKSTPEHLLFRLAKLLFWTPILLAVPVFFFVGDTVPDLNRGSIGDGFRKLNVLFSAMLVALLAPRLIVLETLRNHLGSLDGLKKMLEIRHT